MKKNIRQSHIVLIVAVAVAAGFAAGSFLAMRTRVGIGSPVRMASANGDRGLQEAVSTIARNYVDSISPDTLVTLALDGLLHGLDPHSSYVPPSNRKETEETMMGNFYGIGMQMHMAHDTCCAGGIVAGGGAEAAGMQVGDRILMIDGDTVAGKGMSTDEIRHRLRGERGTRIVITVQRYGERDTRQLHVHRDLVRVPSVAYSGMLDGEVGVVMLTDFHDGTYHEVHNAIAALKRQGMTHLLLDLRSNGGGLMDQAIRIADDLLPAGRLITYTNGNKQPRTDYRSHRKGEFSQGDITVLIDEGSASASELLTGALQDNDRATVVGRRSFGKGLVQHVYPLSNGGSLILAVARYYTPSGRCIQRPYDKGVESYYLDRMQESIAEGFDSSLIAITDSTPYLTMQGRTVYGGGGIYPDHVIPYSSDTLLGRVRSYCRAAHIEEFVFRYVAAHWDELRKTYSSADDFVARYRTPASLIDSFVGQASAAGRKLPSSARAQQLLSSYLKAELGRMLFDIRAYSGSLVGLDPDVRKALEIIQAHHK